MTGQGRRGMSGADALWLSADRPNHLMVIDGLMWTDEPLDADRLAGTIQERLVDQYPVFRQRPVDPTWPWELPAWEDDPDFSLDRHLHRVRLPAPGDDRELRRFIEQQVVRPLQRDRPLWEVFLVEGYGEGAAVFYRCHHAMADGMALAQVMLTLTDATAGGDGTGGGAELDGSGADGSLVDVLVSGAGTLVRSALTLPGLPWLALRSLGVARKLLLDTLPSTLLSAEPGSVKRMTWSRARPLPEVKQLSRRTGTTVNDVLVSALSGALAGYLAEHGQSVDRLTTMVPVNIRPPDQPLPRELGNRFALVLLHLPTGSLDARERLAVVHERMSQIKDSPESFITSWVAEGIGHLQRVDQPLVDFFAGKAIGVTTNVIGPKEPRYLAGVEVKGVLGWVPGSGGQTLGVCIFSYADTVRIGFKVDAAAVPEPERLVELFDAELDLLAGQTEPTRS